ncbi:MAG: Mini-ribonuclease 3-like protein [Fusobacteria bacterium]|nr:Mini-ribonuclease 3-like protein [Fusobacteriota bacterium]
MEYVDLNNEDVGILNIAYLGDAVWSLYIRQLLYNKGLSLKKLNNIVEQYVNAKYQSKIYGEIWDMLSENEKKIAKRAENGNIKHYPKSCTMKEYRESTGFEALIAYLYLNKPSKINDIIDIIREKEGI